MQHFRKLRKLMRPDQISWARQNGQVKMGDQINSDDTTTEGPESHTNYSADIVEHHLDADCICGPTREEHAHSDGSVTILFIHHRILDTPEVTERG